MSTLATAEVMRRRKLGPVPTGRFSTFPARETTEHGVFQRQGDYWTIEHRTVVFRMKDSKGLRYLAELLRSPRRLMLACELAAVCGGEPVAGAGRPIEPSLRLCTLSDADQVIDSTARSAYRSRLFDLEEELAEAQRFNDLGRASGLLHERELITLELARGVGPCGRIRRSTSPAERARQSVTHAIKSTLRRIAAYDPDLGRYLAATVKTGKFCCYMPTSQVAVAWQF